MAANEYYHPQPTRPNDHLSFNMNAPLPPVPSTSPSPSRQHTVSPISSPFDDHSYPDPHVSQQSLYSDGHYNGAGSGGRGDNQSPFADDIALKDRSPNNGDHRAWDQTYHPGLEDNQQLQPLDGDGLGKGRKRRLRGFPFNSSGRVPWVVYFFTLVQVTVFIAEIIKNCKYFYRSSNT